MAPFCPKCRAECREDISKCSDCGVPLVKTLPPDGNRNHESDSEMVAVYDAPDQISAGDISAFLNDNGIETVIRSEQIPMYDGVAMMLFARWGQVLTLDIHADRARSLIDDYLAGEPLPDQEDPQK